MAVLYVDNQPHEIRPHEVGKNLLKVCLGLGFNIPYFCWHPAFQSVGACRQCAIKLFKDEHDTKGKIVMSCMVSAKDGMRISIDDPEAIEFRARVIEWLMLNHPHDCPVCDEGGECHLQDMTVMTGHTYRRNRFAKRSFRNQDMGPLVAHEMNRCIQCYRCARFYRHSAGGRDFGVMGWHDRVFFGRFEDGVLQSEFAGNLVEVCPTGVFTDKTQARHFTRKWDLQTAPSVCVHCGLGCNTIPGERYGSLRRIRNRYNHRVNGYFLCDRGRYGYEFVNSPHRIRQPLLRENQAALRPISAQAAITHLGNLLHSGRAIGIGSPRASLETNYALAKLVGAENFYHGMPTKHLRIVRAMLDVLKRGPAPSASLHDMEKCNTIFMMGEDIHNVGPLMVLSLRQAVLQKPIAEAAKLHISDFEDAVIREAIQQEKGPFFTGVPGFTKLDDQVTQAYRGAPHDIARLGFAVAHMIDPAAPAVEDLPVERVQFAQRIAKALQDKKPLIVAGYNCGSESIVRASANVAWALRKKGFAAHLAYTVPECNSMGTALMDGGEIDDAVQAIASNGIDTLIVAESNLYRQLSLSGFDTILRRIKHLVVLDCLPNETTAWAELVLPAATFAEGSGTLVNNECRAQRFYQVFSPAGDVRESWKWLSAAMVASGRAQSEPWPDLDAVLAALARDIPVFAKVPGITPPSSFRLMGMPVPRESHRFSGRTAIDADQTIHERPPEPDADTPLRHSMEGYPLQPPASLLGRYWAPGWNSDHALNKFQQEIDGPLREDAPGVRLVEPSGGQPSAEALNIEYLGLVPPAFQRRAEEWLVIPAYHIFGSDELSMHSPGIAELAAKPYLQLNQADADSLGATPGQLMTMTVESAVCTFPLKVGPGLPDGVVAIPFGLPGLPGVALPAWGKIRPAQPGEPTGVRQA